MEELEHTGHSGFQVLLPFPIEWHRRQRTLYIESWKGKFGNLSNTNFGANIFWCPNTVEKLSQVALLERVNSFQDQFDSIPSRPKPCSYTVTWLS